MTVNANAPCGFRLAAIDLDDTLLGPNRELSPANTEAVCELRARGVEVVLASGRKHENMVGFYQRLGLQGWIVSSQGALVEHGETGEVLHRQPIPVEPATQIVFEAAACDATLIYYHSDAIYVARRNRLTELYCSRGKDDVVEIGDLRRLAGESPLKIIWMDDPAPTATRFRTASERYRGVLDLVVTSPEYLEMMALGINKAAGLAVVAERMGIVPEQALAFGDANNDVQMLHWAGFGVAMTVSSPAARAAARAVAPPGCPAESLARAVAELIRSGRL